MDEVVEHDGDCDCFSCKCRYWREQRPMALSSAATPSRTPPKPTRVRPMNSWERGVAKDERGWPLLNENLSPIGIKEYSANRHKIDADRKAMFQRPTPPPRTPPPS